MDIVFKNIAEVKKMICDKNVENSNDIKSCTEENDKLDFYSKIMETNEKLIKSNIEISSKVDKLENLLNIQQKKLEKKDEKLISLIISQIYSGKSEEKNKDNLFNNIFKKFKSIVEIETKV